LDFYSASSLKQQFADRHVTPLEHIILIPTSLLLFLLNAAYFSGEATSTEIAEVALNNNHSLTLLLAQDKDRF
jgi:hypothetical protein